MELSKRLYAVAGLVTEGASVADIGTDHGYIPIYLAEKEAYKDARFIAVDINAGPLERAKEHIVEYQLERRIETRLSDGLEALKPGEVHTMIAAGMGGALVIHILEANPEITASIREFVLQPQSEIAKVRAYLEFHDFVIVKEDMVEEDGKYYPMMKVRHKEDGGRDTIEEKKPYTELELLYGPCLLRERNPVLAEYLNRERKIRAGILAGLAAQATDRARERIEELEIELSQIERALRMYEDQEEYICFAETS